MGKKEVKLKVAVLHHNDADGFGAAFAAHCALGDSCEMMYIEVQYNQPAPIEKLTEFAPDEIYVVDFCYPLEDLILLDTLAKVMVIDHHKTSAEIVAQWGGDYRHDVLKAGCTLAWEYFMPHADIPDLLLYVADRDMWRFELEHSKEINAYIATMEKDFDVWADFYTPGAYDCGVALIKLTRMQIVRRLQDVMLYSLDHPLFEAAGLSKTQYIPFVNASENISELGEAMCEEYPDALFSVSYCDRADGARSYSLRSRNGFDVSAIAKELGGGGHAAAAGFSLPAPKAI